jgi:hypothetical protein
MQMPTRLYLPVLLLTCTLAAQAASCPSDLTNSLAGKAVGVVCFHSPDLTTKNIGIIDSATSPPAGPTTPPDNSITGLPARAFTPTADRGVISTGPAPIQAPVPGFEVEAYFANDPTHQARFLLRLPDQWNGKLVVAGASGTRSEFNGDFAWSDYVIQKGYAYASQNKGVWNFRLSDTNDPLACRYNPNTTLTALPIHFYDVEPSKPFTQWTDYMLEAARLAKGALKAYYHRPVRFTYAVGTSNGGYQVRRAMEKGSDLFDGGVDWEGTFIDRRGPNLLMDLPPVLKNFPAYVTSGYDSNSSAAQAILAAGYPPDIVLQDAQGKVANSLWAKHWTEFWEVTMCQWQKRFDPTYATYSAGLDNYNYSARSGEPGVAASLAAVATTGKIKKPLITVAGTMDALLPITRNAQSYEKLVNASLQGKEAKRKALYRLYEVQNGTHIEGYTTIFPQLQLVQPYAQQAFDRLVDYVENRVPLPPSQCIPLASVPNQVSSIVPNPAEPGHCAKLLGP